MSPLQPDQSGEIEGAVAVGVSWEEIQEKEGVEGRTASVQAAAVDEVAEQAF